MKRTKACIPVFLLGYDRASPIIEAYFEFVHLKQLYRQGWLNNQVAPDDCESVADHTFGTMMLCMLIADAHFPDLDLTKMFKMALLHDVGETYAGDQILDPTNGTQAQKDNKYSLEKDSMEQIFNKMPNGKEYIKLWQEYAEGTSPEARLIKQVDKLEAVFQATVYKIQEKSDFKTFFESAKAQLRDESIIKLFNELSDIAATIDLDTETSPTDDPQKAKP